MIYNIFIWQNISSFSIKQNTNSFPLSKINLVHNLRYVFVIEQQMGSCCPLPFSRQNSGGGGLVKKERSLYSTATGF